MNGNAKKNQGWGSKFVSMRELESERNKTQRKTVGRELEKS